MTEEIYVEGDRNQDGSLNLPLVSTAVLFVARYCHANHFQFVIVSMTTENAENRNEETVDVDSSILKDLNVKFLEKSSLPSLVSNCVLPVAVDNQTSTIRCGLCGTVRYIVQSSHAQTPEKCYLDLLGFRQGSLRMCAEVSGWTKLCEIELPASIYKLVLIIKNTTEEKSKVIELPVDILKLEMHFEKPPKIHNDHKLKKKILVENKMAILESESSSEFLKTECKRRNDCVFERDIVLPHGLRRYRVIKNVHNTLYLKNERNYRRERVKKEKIKPERSTEPRTATPAKTDAEKAESRKAKKKRKQERRTARFLAEQEAERERMVAREQNGCLAMATETLSKICDDGDGSMVNICGDDNDFKETTQETMKKIHNDNQRSTPNICGDDNECNENYSLKFTLEKMKKNDNDIEPNKSDICGDTNDCSEISNCSEIDTGITGSEKGEKLPERLSEKFEGLTITREEERFYTDDEIKESFQTLSVLDVEFVHVYSEGLEMTVADLILFVFIYYIMESLDFKTTELGIHLPNIARWLDHMTSLTSIQKTGEICGFNLAGCHGNQGDGGSRDITFVKSDLPDSVEDEIDLHRRNKTTVRAYKPEIAEILTKINKENIQVQHGHHPRKDDVKIDWSTLPTSAHPLDGDVPVKRIKRKCEQLENLVTAVLELSKDGDIIVDFCSGGGHLGIVIAFLLPRCKVYLIENKEESIDKARKRLKSLQLNNVIIYQCNLGYFHGKFDIGVCLHACGVATDMVLQQCLDNVASFVICPCCYGSIVKTHTISYPRSRKYQRCGISYKEFLTLGHGADQTEFNMKLADQGCYCANLVDTDRAELAREQNYQVTLCSLQPLSCTPKNNLLIGVPLK